MKDRTLTKMEKRLLQALLENPNATLAKIAKDYDIPIGSIYRLFNNLFKLGYISTRKYVINYQKIGLKKIVVIMIHFENETLADVFYSKYSTSPYIEEILITNNNEVFLKCIFRDDTEQKLFLNKMLKEENLSEHEIKIYQIKNLMEKTVHLEKISEEKNITFEEGYFPR